MAASSATRTGDTAGDADLLPSDRDDSTSGPIVPMGEPVNARVLTLDRRLVIAVAAAVALEHLLIGTHLPADSWAQHSRSVEWALIATATVILMILVRGLSIGCWLVLAGAAANVISWAEHGSVPD